MVYEGRIKVPYLWSVGETGSRFLEALRDRQEIWGTRCPQCRKVFVYPVKHCGECFVPIGEWVRVGHSGTLESFTIARYAHSMQPVAPPLAYGLIRLDGADGSLLHLIGDADLGKLKVGMRMKAVFAPERKGAITDIRYFTPAG
jgi:hypothetical protein